MSNTTEILLVCSAGMSTSMLMGNMEKEAKKKGLDVNIQAMASGAANKHLAKQKVDVLLLGPQIRYMKKSYEKKVEGTDTVLGVIDMQDYGRMDGEKVLKTALELQNNN